ncbi:ABC transporter substrate-binding protein [Quisquiliibacterium transsilvanicum]|jgi:branched-chain amino acid transport system substrate-binding protein|uniref:Branched-chain amino acid transport system substrate-binding protein n=1 Tax=Quisquiliibacterium transsilvanicum TaxID=1549638 RepID=A0A7W8HHU6_9BURK|nr:ABC transporter substrate-binding protein [Quisquiliibacterium transsilvanicum]MBB5272300.1 branched-chain amino acid transport system substrate-binding protein [Quisquiliibacterium transsilvanicum]
MKFAQFTRIALAVAVASAATLASAAEEIRIGNTVPYSGPASFYGMVGKGTAAYFAKVNDEGGINGRKVKVISLDDSLAPPKTVEQVRRMVEQDEVHAIVNQVGTATASSVRKYLNTKKVPQLFVQSGSNNFQQPKEFPYSTSALMNYEFEAKVYGKQILAANPKAKIGILYQNDDYGKDYLRGLKATAGKAVVSEITYEQTDPTVDSQILALKGAGVDVVLLAAYSKQVSQSLRKMDEIGWKPLVYLSHVSAQVHPTLSIVGLDKVVGVLTASIIKDPSDSRWHNDADYKEWLAWMKKYYPDGDINNSSNASVYASASALAHVLKAAGTDMSRENILKQMTSLKDFKAPMLLPGITMNMSKDNYNLFRKIQLMRFDGKSWALVGEPVGE